MIFPLYRFHFMDGQFHTVEFDPSSTAQEVLRLVKSKIGLRDGAEGYAIYEVSCRSEQNLKVEDMCTGLKVRIQIRIRRLSVPHVKLSLFLYNFKLF
jgi:hypothetical protein